MKKMFHASLVFAFMLTLAACGSGTEPDSAPDAQSPAVKPAGGEPAEAPENAASAGDPQSHRVLIAYFSWSGNTEKLANIIQAEIGGDLFEIVPETPYTDDYNALLEIAAQKQGDQARPPVAGTVENWADYDTVFIGYPNWWSDTPMVVRTFLESYDWAGKTVIPFCTHGSGGFGRSVQSVTESASGAEVLDGFKVAGSRVDGAEEAVTAWISGLGLEG